MPFNGKRPVLADPVRALLETWAASRSETHSLVQRSSIVLGYADGKSQEKQGRQLGLSVGCIWFWRHRWRERSPTLVLDPEDGPSLEMQLRDLFTDLSGRGRKDNFSAEQVAGIVALSLRKPRDVGVEAENWTHELLAQAAIDQGIVPTISASRVGVFLKRDRYKTPSGERMVESYHRRSGRL